MGRRRPTDFVGWRLYRRAWLLPVLALLVLLVTSFRPDAPVASTLPPTLANEQAVELLAAAKDFDAEFPDRRPNTPGAVDSASWMQQQFEDIDASEPLQVRTVPTTTIDPA